LFVAVKAWEAKKGVNVGDILNMNGEEFEDMRRELVEHVRQELIALKFETW